MKANLYQTYFIILVLLFLSPNATMAQEKGQDCGESCFSTEVVSMEELDNGCLKYTILVSAGGECAHALSHFSMDIPCGEVSQVTNSGDWKVAYGLDPTSGQNGFKIDDIQGFGEDNLSSTFEVSFVLCPEIDCDAEALTCWQPEVAYKASTCVYYEEVSVQCKKLEAILIASDVTCSGAADGMLSVNIIEGSEPYTFIWAHDDLLTTSELTGVSGGNYSVIVTDATGESVELAAAVKEPVAIELTETITNASCSGNSDGNIAVMVSGGEAPYAFEWSHGPETSELTEVEPGIYILTVRDASDCSVTKAFTVGVANEILITGDITQTGCSSATGAIDVSVEGGSGDYTYLWSNESTSEDLSGLSAGTYSLTVTDNSGCSAKRNFYVTARNTLRISATRSNTSCIEDNSGSIDLSVSGGTAPYSFQWSTGADSEDLDNLAAGFYEVTVTDAEGCGSTIQLVIGTNTVNVTGTVNKPTCHGEEDGSIVLSPGSNEGDLMYAWSTGESGSSLTNLGSGVYSVTVSNEEGCEKTFTYVVSDPIPVIVSSAVSNTNCEEGAYEIEITVSGGMGTLTYQWDDGVNSEDRSGLTSGTYTLVVTDENGCTQEHLVEVNATAANCTDTQDPVDLEDPTDPVDPDDPVTPGNPGDCSDPYDASMELLNRDGNCFTYKMTVTYDGNKSYGLSHVTLDIPCGDVSQISNSGGWKIEKGKDPRTSLFGIKIDDISGFGEGSRADEFTLEFQICTGNNQCADQLTGWQPVVGFKYGQCINIEGVDMEANYVSTNVFPNPFTSSVNIQYEMPLTGNVRVEIFSESGVKKADLFYGVLEGGERNSWTWIPEASDREGVYLYRITTDFGVDLGKIMLIR